MLTRLSRRAFSAGVGFLCAHGSFPFRTLLPVPCCSSPRFVPPRHCLATPLSPRWHPSLSFADPKRVETLFFSPSSQLRPFISQDSPFGFVHFLLSPPRFPFRNNPFFFSNSFYRPEIESVPPSIFRGESDSTSSLAGFSFSHGTPTF